MIVLVAPPAHLREGGGARQTMVAVAQLRLMVLLLLFAAAFAAILVRLVVLAMAAERPEPVDLSAALIPPRADIVDRDGRPLAQTVEGLTIGVWPARVIGDKDALAAALAQLMPEESAAKYRRLMEGKGYHYLRRRASAELANAVHALGEPGIGFGREPERLYPQGTIAAQVVGFVDVDGKGVRGLEHRFEARLVGQRDTPLVTSIDVRVQGALEGELARSMAETRAVGAAGVVLDVDTGEVLALVSLPSFNPNKVAATSFNAVTQGRYELGSAFKPIAVAAALDAGTTKLNRRYDATKPVHVGRFTIDDHDAQRRWLSIPELLIHSSNIATAKLAEEMGRAPLEAIFRKLHFDQPTTIEIEKWGPFWPKDWGLSTTLTTAYGHGISVTPLHLASAYAALVNGGLWRPATLMKATPGTVPAGERVVTEATSARIRQLLRLIVTDGTGKQADAPGYRVGGKTGTAERPSAGGYSASKNVSTFAAAFPMDAPRYVVLAMLDSPNSESGARTAGLTAAPVVARVVQRVGPLLGVIPDRNRDLDVRELRPLIWHPPAPDGPAKAGGQ